MGKKPVAHVYISFCVCDVCTLWLMHAPCIVGGVSSVCPPAVVPAPAAPL